jgi:hypothetical protein
MDRAIVAIRDNKLEADEEQESADSAIVAIREDNYKSRQCQDDHRQLNWTRTKPTEPLWPLATSIRSTEKKKKSCGASAGVTRGLPRSAGVNRRRYEEQELQECQSLAPEEEECITGMKFRTKKIEEVRSSITKMRTRESVGFQKQQENRMN